MSKKATASDAQLILQLYDLRREAEMRKARSWWLGEFWPQSDDDYTKVAGAMGSQENNWLRQVIGYWSMAASFVLHGALNEDLFLQPAVSGEMYFVFAMAVLLVAVLCLSVYAWHMRSTASASIASCSACVRRR